MIENPSKSILFMFYLAIACILLSIILIFSGYQHISFIPAIAYSFLMVNFSLNRQPEHLRFRLTWKRLIAGLLNPDKLTRMLDANHRYNRIKSRFNEKRLEKKGAINAPE